MSITRERAATWFETMHPPGPAAREMYRMAAKALRPVSREQVEKVWRGEWEEERFAGELEGWQHRECGRHSTEKSMRCPKCGKAMTDEAVDMVMEKWKDVLNEH